MFFLLRNYYIHTVYSGDQNNLQFPTFRGHCLVLFEVILTVFQHISWVKYILKHSMKTFKWEIWPKNIENTFRYLWNLVLISLIIWHTHGERRTDPKHLFGYDGKHYVQRQTGERLNPNCVKTSVKGGGSVMVWQMFSAVEVGPLIELHGYMFTHYSHRTVEETGRRLDQDHTRAVWETIVMSCGHRCAGVLQSNSFLTAVTFRNFSCSLSVCYNHCCSLICITVFHKIKGLCWSALVIL